MVCEYCSVVHLHPGVLPPGLEGKPGKTLADFLHWACVSLLWMGLFSPVYRVYSLFYSLFFFF